jgi:hypothetical protein
MGCQGIDIGYNWLGIGYNGGSSERGHGLSGSIKFLLKRDAG